MWPFFAVISTPSLQLFGRICKRQDAMRVQAFCSEPAVKCFYEGVVRGLSRSGEVLGDAAQIGPQVHVASYEFTALVGADGFGGTRLPADPIQRRHDIFATIAGFRIQNLYIS